MSRFAPSNVLVHPALAGRRAALRALQHATGRQIVRRGWRLWLMQEQRHAA